MIEAEPALECAGEFSVLGNQSLYLGAIALALQPFLAIGRTLLREQHVHQQIGGIDLAGHVIIERQLHEAPRVARHRRFAQRSEEHTSELQSLMRISYAVFCLKKKKT